MLHSTNHSPHRIVAPKFMAAYEALNLSSPQITFKKTSFFKKKIIQKQKPFPKLQRRHHSGYTTINKCKRE